MTRSRFPSDKQSSYRTDEAFKITKNKEVKLKAAAPVTMLASLLN